MVHVSTVNEVRLSGIGVRFEFETDEAIRVA
jgi:hypothetical protein